MTALRLFACLALAATAAVAQQPYLPVLVDAGRTRGEILFHTEAVLRPQPELGNDYGAYAEALGDRAPDRLVIPVSLGGGAQGRSSERSWVVFPNGSADPEDPTSYDFGPVDGVVAGAGGQGLTVVARLDVSSSGAANGSSLVEGARRVAMHFNHGWEQGREFGIREWRVCDADLPQTREMSNETGGFGLASPAAEAVVDGLRRLDAELSVGACLPWRGDALAANTATPSRSAGRPPHFYSWVFPETIGDAREPARMAQQLRDWLDGSGNAGIDLYMLSPRPSVDPFSQRASDPAEQAARLAAALVHLRDAPVTSVALDLWSPARNSLETKRQAVLQAAAQFGETPVRLATAGGGSEAYAVLAGRSNDRTSVQILIANHHPSIPARTSHQPEAGAGTSPKAQAPQGPTIASEGTASEGAARQGYELEVANLPWGEADFGVYAYRIDGGHDLAPVWEGGGRGGSFQIRRKLPLQAVELIVLQPEDRPVYDRLPRRRSRR